jgi:hypothetical protein
MKILTAQEKKDVIAGAKKAWKAAKWTWGVVQEGSRRANINIAATRAEIDSQRPSSQQVLGLGQPSVRNVGLGIKSSLPRTSLGLSQARLLVPEQNRLLSRAERKAIRKTATRFNPLEGVI